MFIAYHMHLLYANFFIYFFSKSRQKASLLSNRFAFKGVRNDNILLMIIDKGTLYG